MGEGRLRVPGKTIQIMGFVRPGKGKGGVGGRRPSRRVQRSWQAVLEKTAGVWRTRPERREAMKGGEEEESSEQARSEQAPAERGVAAAR